LRATVARGADASLRGMLGSQCLRDILAGAPGC
jgi:hypothetical protein